MTLPNLLYISPTVPRPTGSGLAMRAYHILQAISAEYRVYLAVVDRHLRWGERDDFLEDLCQEVAMVPAISWYDPALFLRRRLKKVSPRAFHTIFCRPMEWADISRRRINKVFDAFQGVHFDRLHAFRLFTAPFLKPFMARQPPAPCQLDMDDIESVTARRIGALYRMNGDMKAALVCRREADLYESAERRLLPRFERIFVCSDGDAAFLRRKYGCRRTSVVPNVVPIPPTAAREHAGVPFTFLFVGTLRYYPNREALVFFCRKVLPRIRESSGKEFRIAVLGPGLDPSMRRFFSAFPEVQPIGYVPDPTPYYHTADACLVPVRGGGGTRIKVIEAFAQNRPVVSTTIGMEGIRAVPDEHLLIGDTPDEFARQCVRLMSEPELRKKLSDSALSLVRGLYATEALRSSLHVDKNT